MKCLQAFIDIHLHSIYLYRQYTCACVTGLRRYRHASSSARHVTIHATLSGNNKCSKTQQIHLLRCLTEQVEALTCRCHQRKIERITEVILTYPPATLNNCS